ncbi:efflux RND transporter periplasmic adaptor subunit [Neorhizobium sp. IRAMC:178]|uniref:efflux RND transporter periplasmic adaptor subunit n=1 Tax=Neorhizobium tunisiense TaxID=3144793 RepID=UPI0031F6A7AE
MRLLSIAATLLLAGAANAETVKLKPVTVTEWKAVYGTIEARNIVPARARLGGTVTQLSATEGDIVKAGQKIAMVEDEKLGFQIAALDAQIGALRSQLTAAQADLARGEALVERGIVTQQRLDELRSQAGVLQNQITATEAQRSVVIQQQSEGEVDAPADGKVLIVPLTRGAVILAGEPVATIGGGGLFLRLSIPERHASALSQEAEIRINIDGRQIAGKLVKIYPQIENGRVTADVEAGELNTAFVNARVLVQVPVGERQALLVPANAVVTRNGVDFVSVHEDGETVERAVVSSETIGRPDGTYREILTGLAPGDEVVLP